MALLLEQVCRPFMRPLRKLSPLKDHVGDPWSKNMQFTVMVLTHMVG